MLLRCAVPLLVLLLAPGKEALPAIEARRGADGLRAVNRFALAHAAEPLPDWAAGDA